MSGICPSPRRVSAKGWWRNPFGAAWTAREGGLYSGLCLSCSYRRRDGLLAADRREGRRGIEPRRENHSARPPHLASARLSGPREERLVVRRYARQCDGVTPFDAAA